MLLNHCTYQYLPRFCNMNKSNLQYKEVQDDQS